MSRALTILAAVALLALAPAAEARVQTKLDVPNEIRMTLDGRTLTATIVDLARVEQSPQIRRELFGKQVVVGCGTTFREAGRRTRVGRRAIWVDGATTMSFRFRRDISRRAKWCLIEEGEGRFRGVDLAFVSFREREPARLLAKGRGPSGDWWRLSAWRSERLAPCLGLRWAGFASTKCYDDQAEREARLSASVVRPGCFGDAYVLGAVARRTATVSVAIGNGSTLEAPVFARPRGSRARARYFLAVLPRETEVRAVEALAASGERVGIDRHPEQSMFGGVCNQD